MINSNAGIGGRRSTASTFSHSTAVWLAVSYRYYLPGSLRLYALLCLSVPDIPNNPSSDQDSIEFPFWVCRRRCAELRPRLSVQSPRFYSLFELDRRFPGTRSARTASICLVGSWARLPALLQIEELLGRALRLTLLGDHEPARLAASRGGWSSRLAAKPWASVLPPRIIPP